ncbi:MAG: hypothetical protein HUJ77_11830 [Clostridium sp.]|uniref:hypothetical protein n=1 Tax=Clostridium sp. TaxID=1506 RepID=UPI0025C5F135|nr:hypothetical protein [Clostridium sp.]MCF0149073.1 hypothetical protein [Clostridium sp.]
MKSKECNDFLLRTKDKKLLKFYHKEKIGIICCEFINNKIVNKKILAKGCLKYFYIFEDNNTNINLIYQDLTGKIILCHLSEGNVNFKTIFYTKTNFITPINIKAISLIDNSFIFYTLDSDPTKVYFRNNISSESVIIYKEKSDIDINYKILHDKENISLIILSTSFNMFKIIFKTYNLKNKKWDNHRIIFISRRSYIDSSFCLVDTKIHSLFIINEEGKKSLIYKYNSLEKDQYTQREFIIYEDENLSSCLIIEMKNIVYLLWISKNKLYSCYSLNFGESFSKPLICIDSLKDCIRKIDFIDNGELKEIYLGEKLGEITLFLEKIIKHNDSFHINHKEITYKPKDKKEVLQLKI